MNISDYEMINYIFKMNCHNSGMNHFTIKRILPSIQKDWFNMINETSRNDLFNMKSDTFKLRKESFSSKNGSCHLRTETSNIINKSL